MAALTPGATPSCCVPAFSDDNTVTSCLDFPACIPPLFNLVPTLIMQNFGLTLALKPLFLFRPLCIFFLCTLSSTSRSWLSLYTSCFLFPLTHLGFFNGTLVVSEPGALNFYTLFHPTPLTLSVSRHLISTHLPFSGFLDSLLSDLIVPTPSLVFSLVMPRTLVAASSFSSGGAYPFLNFLPSLFLRLTPTMIM